jgi:D-arabinose 1-dehydrogenase-like Zn-dependent alcohol dehydrogenase
LPLGRKEVRGFWVIVVDTLHSYNTTLQVTPQWSNQTGILHRWVCQLAFVTISHLALSATRVNYNAALVGGIPKTHEIVAYCANNKIYSQIQVINAEQLNDAWKKVLNKRSSLSLCK